jgi:hypothetical protein
VSSASFTLLPFRPGWDAGITITGTVRRSGGRFALELLLSGSVDRLLLHPPAATRREGAGPRRRDELWRHTCLEAFLARPDGPAYWELNGSPCGDWNVYRFRDYRRRGVAETAVAAMESRLEGSGAERHGRLALSLPAPLAEAPVLEVAVTMVLETDTADGEDALAYRALCHPGEAPDFHLREGFLLRL